MATMDIFHQDPFTSISMTEAVERNPYVPNGIGRLNIFEDDPIITEALAVEERSGVISLVPVSERGAPPTERTTELRDIRYFKAPRIAVGDTLKASEIANIRAFGQQTKLMSMQKEVARRLYGPTGLLPIVEYTRENMRLGAISGILLDADNSTVIYNWFTQFGISAPAEIAFNLGGWVAGAGTATSDGALRIACNNVVRGMKRAAKGAFIEGVTEVWAMCGDSFWDKLITHKDVVDTYRNWMAAAQLRGGTAFGQFEFGGVNWFNYRGSDDATTVGVATTKVKFFLRNAPGVFRVAWAPGESFQWVNQPGKKEYVLPIPDRDRNEWWRVEVKSYPLYICTRPETLFSGREGT